MIDLNFNLVVSAGFSNLRSIGGVSFEERPMSNTAVKVASVFFVVLASTTGSFARGGGSAGAVRGVRPNVGAIGAAQSRVVDPSGIANAQKVAPLPPPRISVPQVSQFK